MRRCVSERRRRRIACELLRKREVVKLGGLKKKVSAEEGKICAAAVVE